MLAVSGRKLTSQKNNNTAIVHATERLIIPVDQNPNWSPLDHLQHPYQMTLTIYYIHIK